MMASVCALRSLPNYYGDPHQHFPCQNAIAVTNTAVNIPLHENYGADECADIAETLMKVEQAFLR